MKSLICLASLCLLAFCLTARPSIAQDNSLEAALPSIRQMGDQNALVSALSATAMQHMQAGRIEQATERINEAIAIGRRSGNAETLQFPLMIATQVMSKMDDDAGEKFLLRLLREDAGNVETEMAVLKTLGQSLLQSGDLVRAIQFMHDYHERLAKTQPGSDAQINALQSYGHACMMGNMFDLGVPALKRARKLALQSSNNLLAGLCTTRFGDACFQSGDYATAKTLFRKQLDEALVNNDTTNAMLGRNSLVATLLQLEDLEGAKSLISQSLPKLSGYEKGYLQGVASVISAHEGDYVAAISLSRQAIDSKLADYPAFIRETMGPQVTTADYLAIAHYQLLAGNPAEAAKAIDQAEQGHQAMVQQIRAAAQGGMLKQNEVETAMSFTPAAISSVRQQILMANNQAEAALVESETGRGQIQARAMRKLFQASNQVPPAKLTLDAIRGVAKTTGATLVQYTVIDPLDSTARNLLPSSSPLKHPRSLFVWVVTSSGEIKHHVIDLPRPLVQMVRDFRSAILPNKTANQVDESDATRIGTAAEAQQQSFTKTSRALYDLLIAPIESDLPADPNATVVMIPQGELFAIPFAALLDEQGDHLIDKHTLVTAPSIEIFRLSSSRPKRPGKLSKDELLIVGNPEMPAYLARPDEAPTQLSSLPGSEAEAKAIAQLFGIEPLIGSQATETTVCQRMKTARVIHLATHGLLESENAFNRPYLSAIALAPNDEENGFLTVREVTGMKLTADLVVLSACDTGRGQITGEGITGLSQAYLTAGVPTTVVSLWPVSDKATAVLMTHFYEALGQGKSTAAALRAATLANRDQFESPRLWAPFAVYGIGR